MKLNRLKYEYEIEYEFNIGKIKESVMLITFSNNNEIYNLFDLTDNKNVNKIKNLLFMKALSGDIGAKKLENKFPDFMNVITPLVKQYKNKIDNIATANV